MSEIKFDDPLDDGGLTAEETRMDANGVRNLDMLDVTKILEGANIPCCIVGVGALRYYGAWRVLHAWEVCVPSDLLSKAEELLASPPYDSTYERCPHGVAQLWSIAHTLPFFKLKGVWLRFYLIGSDDCHITCTPSSLERSQSGLPYPKLDIFAQSLLDTLAEVNLTDLVDGMDLDNEWAEEHLRLDGTQDIAWTRAFNSRLRDTMTDPLELTDEPRDIRAFWNDIVSNKVQRIGLEWPPGHMKTRFRSMRQGDPRLRDRKDV